MGNIKELDPKIYNRIAAGEVIENPASVVKELLENSIDAHSTDIKIIIKQSGKKEITVIDNGDGMDSDDLFLSIKKHATSKIDSVKDLNNIKTMGFRGEALSSIVSVGIVEMISKTEKMDSGVKLFIENSGRDIKESRVPANRGTTIKVRNIFYNTPARFKFLKGDKKELLNIKDAINKLVITNYDISFQLHYEMDKPVILKAGKNMLDRLKDIYGKEFCEELIPFEGKSSSFTLFGYISKPMFNKPNRNYQFLFLNGRPITTNFFHYWINMGYENLLMKKRYPVAFICIKAPSAFFDVNVHPAKREVRFVNEKMVSGTLIKTIKDVLNKGLLIPSISKTYTTEEIQKEFTKRVDQSIDKFIKNQEYQEKITGAVGDVVGTPSLSQSMENAAGQYNYLVFFNTYILYEDKKENSIYIVDQHAAHERILYERLKRSLDKQEELSQNLLLPINLHLSPPEYQIVMNNKDVFTGIGYNIEEFGNNTLIINSVPAYVDHADDKQLFLDIISDLMDNKNIKKRSLKDEVLKTMACRSALKAGEKLNYREIEVLLKDLLYEESRYTCPHGRPAIIRLERKEIEKWFKRK